MSFAEIPMILTTGLISGIVIALFTFGLMASIYPMENQVFAQQPEPPLPDGTLIKEQNDPAVYYIEGGKRMHIQTEQSFNAYGFSFNNIRVVPDGALANIPLGQPLPLVPPSLPPHGTLIKEQNNPAVYYIEDGKRRHIQTEQSFNAHGFSFNNIRVVPDGALANIPLGEPLPPAPPPPPPPPPVPAAPPVMPQQPQQDIGKVEVVFQSIRIHDDEDPGWFGARGEYDLHAIVNGIDRNLGGPGTKLWNVNSGTTYGLEYVQPVVLDMSKSGGIFMLDTFGQEVDGCQTFKFGIPEPVVKYGTLAAAGGNPQTASTYRNFMTDLEDTISKFQIACTIDPNDYIGEIHDTFNPPIAAGVGPHSTRSDSGTGSFTLTYWIKVAP
jgi:hypothetical protein